MPIQVDSRAGSQDIVQPLRRLGLEVEVCRLEYGDLSWLGFGPNGVPITVGVELKRWSDVIACIGSGRFAGHQLPGLLKSYDDCWLLIYGQTRMRATDGIMEELRPGRNGGVYWAPVGGGGRGWLARDVESWLMSMQVMGRVRVQREPSLEMAALWVRTASNWYAREEHKSHLAMYATKQLYADTAMLIKPPLTRRIAAELPGVGITRSKAVADHFKTVECMVNASESEWVNLAVDGDKRFGVRGRKVWEAIRGHERNGNGQSGSNPFKKGKR